MKTEEKTITDILRDSGYRATLARIAILKVLIKAGQPLKMIELKNKLERKIDPATIYRTLESFFDKRLVRKVRFNDRSTRYEILLGVNHHHHVICQRCGKLEGIDICDEKLEKKALSQSKLFGKIKSHSVEFFGLCKKCL